MTWARSAPAVSHAKPVYKADEDLTNSVADEHAPAYKAALKRAFDRLRAGLADETQGVTLSSLMSPAFIASLASFQAFQEYLTEATKKELYAALTAAGGAAADAMKIAPAFTFDYTNPVALQWAEDHAAKLVTSVTSNTMEAINTAIQRAFAEQRDVPTTAGEIKDVLRRDLSGYAGLLPRDWQAVDTYKAGLLEDGTSPVRAEGLAQKLANRYLNRRSDNIARTECLPGDALIDAGVVWAAYRRWYVGDLCEIITRGSRKFTATPNHPVLTPGGWQAVGLLKEGDYLISYRRKQRVRASGDVDVEARPASISEVFDAVGAVGVPERRSIGNPDFHGDGQDGEVDVFCSNRVLRLGNYVPFDQPLFDLFLKSADESRAPQCRVCRKLLPINQRISLCSGAFCHMVVAKYSAYQFATYGKIICYIVKRFSRDVTLHNLLLGYIAAQVGWATATLKEVLSRLAQGSVLTGGLDDFGYPFRRGIHALRNERVAQSREIELDCVVSVALRPFDGHVYNLSCPDGYFVANGVYTGNTLRASNQGQIQFWDQASQAGLINPAQARQAWVLTEDEKTCQRCEDLAIADENQDVAIGGEFTTPEGDKIDGPPLHPSCRCTVSLEFDDVAKTHDGAIRAWQTRRRNAALGPGYRRIRPASTPPTPTPTPTPTPRPDVIPAGGIPAVPTNEDLFGYEASSGPMKLKITRGFRYGLDRKEAGVSFDIFQNNERIGQMDVGYSRPGHDDVLEVDMVSAVGTRPSAASQQFSGTPNSLGPANVLHVARVLRKFFPQTKKISGYRVTGARRRHGAAATTSLAMTKAEKSFIEQLIEAFEWLNEHEPLDENGEPVEKTHEGALRAWETRDRGAGEKGSLGRWAEGQTLVIDRVGHEKDFVARQEADDQDYKKLGERIGEQDYTPRELGAVHAYTLPSVGGELGVYQDLNSALRHGGEPQLRMSRWAYESLVSAIEKNPLPVDVTALRGLSNIEKAFGTDDPKELVGKTFVDHGFPSVTTSPAVAASFTKGTEKGALIEMELPAGTPAWYVGKTAKAPEDELILGTGHTFEITEVVPKGVKIGEGTFGAERSYDLIRVRLKGPAVSKHPDWVIKGIPVGGSNRFVWEPDDIEVQVEKTHEGALHAWDTRGRGRHGAVLHTGNVNAALRALAEGRKVELKQPRQLSTLLDRLAAIVKDASEKGEKAPTYNLCNVSVKGTNLFCAESKGIPRIKMPQLTGVPKPGSPADDLPKDKNGKVNIGPAFRKYLTDKGIDIEKTKEKAAYLRASQDELDGAKIARNFKKFKERGRKTPRIFVSRDNYIIDGHHKWAVKVGADVLDNKLGDVSIKVSRIDMGILAALREANKFAAKMGLERRAVGKAGTHEGALHAWDTRGRKESEPYPLMSGILSGLRHGGFTLNPVTGKSPKSGFVVSFPRELGTEKVVADDEFFKDEEKAAKIVGDYLVRNWSRFAENPKAYFGGWRDESNHKIYFDISEVYQGVSDAVRVAQERKQEAIYDLEAGKTIPKEDYQRHSGEARSGLHKDAGGAEGEDPGILASGGEAFTWEPGQVELAPPVSHAKLVEKTHEGALLAWQSRSHGKGGAVSGKSVTEETIQDFMHEVYHSPDIRPAQKKAMEAIKSVKMGEVPGVPHGSLGTVMSVSVAKPITLYINNTHFDSQTRAQLEHELGHVMYEQMKTSKEGKAFAKIVEKDMKAGRDPQEDNRFRRAISSYQDRMFERYSQKKVSLNRVVHESVAEWSKYGIKQDRGAPEQLKAYIALEEAYSKHR